MARDIEHPLSGKHVTKRLSSEELFVLKLKLNKCWKKKACYWTGSITLNTDTAAVMGEDNWNIILSHTSPTESKFWFPPPDGALFHVDSYCHKRNASAFKPTVWWWVSKTRMFYLLGNFGGFSHWEIVSVIKRRLFYDNIIYTLRRVKTGCNCEFNKTWHPFHSCIHCTWGHERSLGGGGGEGACFANSAGGKRSENKNRSDALFGLLTNTGKKKKNPAHLRSLT